MARCLDIRFQLCLDIYRVIYRVEQNWIGIELKSREHLRSSTHEILFTNYWNSIFYLLRQIIWIRSFSISLAHWHAIVTCPHLTNSNVSESHNGKEERERERERENERDICVILLIQQSGCISLHRNQTKVIVGCLGRL